MTTPIRTMTINDICKRKDDLLMSADDIKELARNERNKTIDKFITAYKDYCEDTYGSVADAEIRDMKRVAEQMKSGAKITAIGAKPIEKMKRHKMEIEVEFDSPVTQDEARLMVTSVLAKTVFYKEKNEDGVE